MNITAPYRARTRSRVLLGAAAMTVLLPLAACGSGSDNGGPATSDASATLTVWTDDTREPAVKAFVKAHPDLKVKVVLNSYTAGEIPQKIALADKAGKGWPDVVFLGSPSDVASLSAAPLRFALPLDGLVPESVRAGFAKGTLEGCTYAGKLYCLANDAAPVVLWVNTKLMKDFGYQVPTTWDAYQALGVKLAKEHPGFLVGGINDRDGIGAFLGSSACPDREVAGPTSIKIDLSDERCTRVAKLLQPLIDNGSVTATSPWDPTFTSQVGAKNKILMYPAAAWFGEYGFKGAYKIPNGQLAAYPTPSWPGATTPVTGAEGGGLWVVSRHSKNVKGAAAVAQWLTTSTAKDGIVAASALPAYQPAAKAWCAQRASDPFYATDPCPVEQKAADEIAPNYDYIRFEGQFDDSWAQTVVAAAAKKHDLAGALKTWQGQLEQAAQNAGYQVVK